VLLFRLAAERMRSLLRQPVTFVGTVVLILATMAALSVGLLDLPEQEARRSREASERAKVQIAPSTSHPTGRETELGLRVIRPPNAAAIVLGGPATTLPAAWDMAPSGAVSLEPYLFLRSQGRQELTLPPETVIRVFGALFALVVGVSLGLSDLARKWQAVCAGWRLTPRAVIAADLIGTALALAMVVAVWFAAVVTYLAVAASGPTPALWLTWLAIAPLTWCYLLTFAALGIALVHACRAPGRALIASAAAGVLLILLVPQGTVALATALARAPLAGTFEGERRDVHGDDMAALRLEMEALPSTIPGPRDSDGPTEAHVLATFAANDARYAEGMRRARRRVADMDADYGRMVQADRRLASWLARITPSTTFATSLAEVAGAGLWYVEAWESAVRRYHQALTNALFDDRPIVNLYFGAEGRNQITAAVRHPAPDYADLPAFEPPQRSRVQRWRDGLADIAALGAHTLIALLAAAWFQSRTLNRYRRLLLPDSGRKP